MIRGRFIVVRVRPAQKLPSRFGFVVSTAVAKRATDRNLIKRRLRAIVRSLEQRLTNDAVVYATKNTIRATYDELRQDLTSALLNPPHAPTPYRRH